MITRTNKIFLYVDEYPKFWSQMIFYWFRHSSYEEIHSWLVNHLIHKQHWAASTTAEFGGPRFCCFSIWSFYFEMFQWKLAQIFEYFRDSPSVIFGVNACWWTMPYSCSWTSKKRPLVNDFVHGGPKKHVHEWLFIEEWKKAFITSKKNYSTNNNSVLME